MGIGITITITITDALILSKSIVRIKCDGYEVFMCNICKVDHFTFDVEPESKD